MGTLNPKIQLELILRLKKSQKDVQQVLEQLTSVEFPCPLQISLAGLDAYEDSVKTYCETLRTVVNKENAE